MCVTYDSDQVSSMSDFNRGIMKFDGADSPLAILLSASAILAAIAFLIYWGISTAYL
jgi:hypothetical protein